ncbi:MAG: ABC transporter permease [Lachnospiraceae bacterium]|nr:ABC transporter permease [Lachnospiraceae bacterium]
MHSTSKEPLFHISKRDGISRPKAWGIRLISVLLGLLVSGIVVFLIVKLNPVSVYVSMFLGNFGNKGRTWNMVRDMMILTCIAVGLAPAFKMRFWNIGAEGQMLVGGIVTAFFMIKCPTMNPVLLFICMIVGSIALGGIWGLIPGFFKAQWNTNETLFTLMMNYIAIQFTSFCVSKWENPFGSNTVGIINSKTKIGWIGNMFKAGYNSDFAWTVVIVLAVCVLVYVYMTYTKQGYEISVVGDSENTALYAGIRVKNVYMRTMAISGAICGFSGFLAVSAVSHTISTSTANGRGFTAIIVAWLAKMNPFVMILISALLTFLDKGAVQIASDFGLNEYASQIIMGIMLLFILGSEFFINYSVHFRKKSKEVA